MAVCLVSNGKSLKNPEEANYTSLVLAGTSIKAGGHLTRSINQKSYDTFPNRLPR